MGAKDLVWSDKGEKKWRPVIWRSKDGIADATDTQPECEGGNDEEDADLGCDDQGTCNLNGPCFTGLSDCGVDCGGDVILTARGGDGEDAEFECDDEGTCRSNDPCGQECDGDVLFTEDDDFCDEDLSSSVYDRRFLVEESAVDVETIVNGWDEPARDAFRRVVLEYTQSTDDGA